jgi:hypothetical protein
MDVEQVKKWVALVKELVGVLVVVVPDGKLKDKLKLIADLLDNPLLLDALEKNLKLFEELKKLVK